jgi:hypothetical protein
MKIKAILDIINSKKDRAGNCYWAFRWTDTETGKQVKGRISGNDSNLLWAANHIYPNHDYYYTMHEVSVRDFNSDMMGWDYAGCNPHEIAAWITEKIAKANDNR